MRNVKEKVILANDGAAARANAIESEDALTTPLTAIGNDPESPPQAKLSAGTG